MHLVPRFWREFDRNMSVCKTQQGYSPPLRGGEGEDIDPKFPLDR